MLGETSQRDPFFQWVLIALAVATIFYVAIIRPAMQKKKDPLTYTPIAGNLSKERTVERQMQNLLVELSEMYRQISAQLDTRSQKLQVLIQDADERIAELQKLERTASAVRVPAMGEPSWAGAQMTSVMPILSTTPPATAAGARSAVTQPIDPIDEQHQQVYTLADQGRNAGDIARQLNRPRGEVELILALRPRAAS